MDSVIFEATQACNHDCLHCYNVWKCGRPYPGGQLDTPDTLKLVDRIIQQTRCRIFSFTGGEPLLRTDILPLIERAAARKVSVNLLTNGSLLTEELEHQVQHGVLTKAAAEKAARALAVDMEVMVRDGAVPREGADYWEALKKLDADRRADKIEPRPGADAAGERLVEMTVDKPGMLIEPPDGQKPKTK